VREEVEDLNPHMQKRHHTIATSLDVVAKAEDLGPHTTMSHRDITAAQNMGKEANNRNL
jgi:hypothetical protein